MYFAEGQAEGVVLGRVLGGQCVGGCGVRGPVRDLGIGLRQWPVSSRPPGYHGEAGGSGVGLRGGGGCDRRTLVLPSGRGGGAHVPIPSTQGPADDPEIVSTGHSWAGRGKQGTKGRQAGGGPGPRSERRLGGLTSEELVDQR